MAFFTTFTQFRDFGDFVLGDIFFVPRMKHHVIYKGLHYSSDFNPPYDLGVAEFSDVVPKSIFDTDNSGIYYLATLHSSSQGFVNPADVKGLENFSFLNAFISDPKAEMIKKGNIPLDLWKIMEQETTFKKSRKKSFM